MTRFFRVFVPATSVALLLSEVLLITSAFVIATYLVLQVDPLVFLLYDGGFTRLVPIILTILIGMHFNDLYSRFRIRSRIVLIQQLCLVMGVAFLAQGLISYVLPDLRVSMRVMAWGTALSMVALFWWRVTFNAFALRVMGHDQLLLVGDSPLLLEIDRDVAEHPEKGLRVVGFLSDDHFAKDPIPAAKFLGPVAALSDVVVATRPDRIVVGMSERRSQMPVLELLDLRFAGHIIEEAAATVERITGRVPVQELRPSQLIYSGDLGPRLRTMFAQDVLHRVFSALALVIASPVMLLAALIVRLSSSGPALYRQTRVGLNGVPFTLYKFRSMRQDAEAETGAVWATKDDPRVTPFGRFLRKTRIDELPQLFNVLRGQMAIVGPRPERPEFVRDLAKKIPYYRQRHCVRPGITGWAQVNHKYGDTFEDTVRKLEYDLYYIKHMSFSLNTYIIFHTVKTMLLSRGSQ